MIYTSGKSLIKHAKTGQVYEIKSDLIDFNLIESEERSMGVERMYSAVVNHPQLGRLVWSLWEYPIGAENHRKTDVTPHKLVENIHFELDDHGRRHQIDSMVEWFREENQWQVSNDSVMDAGYCDPIPMQDPREALREFFEGEPEEIIEAAVKEIQSEGIGDRGTIGSPEESGESQLSLFDGHDEKKPTLSSDLQEIATKLDSLIADLPAPQVYPAFSIGDDGVLHLASPPDIQATPSEDPLFEELKATAYDLGQALIGSNAYTVLSSMVEQYNQALSDEQISISRLYALGVKLENVAFSTKRSIEAEDLPAFPLNVEHNLDSTLELHGTYIMSQEEGRSLAESASNYRQSPQQTEKLREAGKQIVASIANHPDLFKEGVKELIARDVEDIGQGEQPEKSNQVATTTIYNLGLGMLLGIGVIGARGIIMALTGETVTGSVPGAAVIEIGSEAINAVWYFLSANLPSFKVIAGFASFDASWITQFSDLLGRLKELIKPR